MERETSVDLEIRIAPLKVGQYVERAFAAVHALIEFAALMTRQLIAPPVDRAPQRRGGFRKFSVAGLKRPAQFRHAIAHCSDRIGRRIARLRPNETSEPTASIFHAPILHL